MTENVENVAVVNWEAECNKLKKDISKIIKEILKDCKYYKLDRVAIKHILKKNGFLLFSNKKILKRVVVE